MRCMWVQYLTKRSEMGVIVESNDYGVKEERPQGDVKQPGAQQSGAD